MAVLLLLCNLPCSGPSCLISFRTAPLHLSVALSTSLTPTTPSRPSCRPRRHRAQCVQDFDQNSIPRASPCLPCEIHPSLLDPKAFPCAHLVLSPCLATTNEYASPTRPFLIVPMSLQTCRPALQPDDATTSDSQQQPDQAEYISSAFTV